MEDGRNPRAFRRGDGAESEDPFSVAKFGTISNAVVRELPDPVAHSIDDNTGVTDALCFDEKTLPAHGRKQIDVVIKRRLAATFVDECLDYSERMLVIPACSFLECCGLGDVDRPPGWMISRARRYCRYDTKRLLRRLDPKERRVWRLDDKLSICEIEIRISDHTSHREDSKEVRRRNSTYRTTGESRTTRKTAFV